jgi:RND family efflux transporter MFP subunit
MLSPCTRRVAAVITGCVALLGLTAFQDSGPPPTPVRAIRAEAREMQAREAVTGSLRAAFDAVLAAREEGAVLEVKVRAGRFVRKDEALVTVDARRLVAQRTGVEASLAEARATAAMASAEADDADEDLRSLEAAAKGGNSVSPRELRRARTLAKSLRAGVDAANKRNEALEAQLELWNLRIADATLRAPFDGTVVETRVEVGEWVSPGTDLVRLVSTGHLEVWLDVPERFMGALGGDAGSNGEIVVRAGAAKGDVVATNVRRVPRVDPGTRTFPLVASIEGDAAAKLSPGMSASGWIPVGERTKTLMVPKDALVYRPAGVAVMTVGGRDEGGATMAGTALMVPIKILFETRREVAVELTEGGLAPGAAVIVEGNERLFPGTPVSASFQGPAKAKDSDGAGR